MSWSYSPLLPATPSSGGGSTYTLDAAAGIFALNGQAASLIRAARVDAASGSFALSGQAAGVLRHYPLAAGVGSFALAGQDVAFRRDLRLDAGNGAFAFSGQAAGLLRHLILAAGEGGFALSGQAAGLLRALRLSVDAGSCALAGQNADLVSDGGEAFLVAGEGVFALSGQAAGLLRALRLSADAGSCALAGQNAGLLRHFPLGADQGSFTLSGQQSAFRLALTLVGATGVFVLSGQDVAFRRVLRLLAEAGGIVLSGQDATIMPGGGEEPEDAEPLLAETGEIAILAPNVSFRISGVPVTAPTTPLAVQRAVLKALTIVLAGRDVPVFDHVPHGQGFPFVELGTMQVLTVDAVEAEGYEIIFYMTVWSTYRGQAEVLQILQLIYDALHNQSLALEHGPLVLSRLTEQRTDRDADGITYMGSATARIMAMV